MKTLIIVLIALIAAKPAFALGKVFVSVERCISASPSAVVNQFIIGGEQSTENQNGKLVIETENYQVDGKPRTSLKAKFIGLDGETLSLSLTNTAGAYAIAKTTTCENSSDAGRLNISASENDQ